LVDSLKALDPRRPIREADKEHSHDHDCNKEQREPPLPRTLLVGNQNDGDDADHAQRHQRVAAVAPKLRAGHSEQEVAHARVVRVTAVNYSSIGMFA
jgi:hypothetical protein